LALDLKKIRGEVAATAADLTKPNAGGGDFEPPQEGPTRLRLVSYIETGVHTTKSAFGEKRKPRAELSFELSGPKHEPKKLDDGTLIPFRVNVKTIVGTHVKNGYIQLFNMMNTDGAAKNFVDMVLEYAWRGVVSHYKYKGRDGKDRVLAQLKDKGAFQIFDTTFSDPETGDTRKVSVPPAISTPRVFLWDYPDLDQWDSIKIEGVRDDGTSKNYIQEKIKSAENFVGSPIYNLLIEAGRADETVPAGKVEAEDDDAEGDEGEKPAGLTEPAATQAPKAPAKAAAKPKAPPKPAAKADPAPADSDPLAGL